MNGMKMRKGLIGIMLIMASTCMANERDSLSYTPSDTLVFTPEVVVKKEKKNIFKGFTNVMDHITGFFMG